MRLTTLLACTAALIFAPGLAACDNILALSGSASEARVVTVEAIDQAAASDVVGRWAGVLEVGGAQLNLVLEIDADGETLSGQLISVDQSNTPIELEAVTFDHGNVRFTDPPRGVVYEGALSADGEIVGTFTQAGRSFPLTFTRQGGQSGANSVDSDDTIVIVTDPQSGQPHQLAGTLTLPNDGARAGVVILSGSGSQDRDGTIAGQHIYAAWAELMADVGVASLRLDDRGVGGSDRIIPDSPADLTHDAATALELVRLETGLSCVGFVGHSEGGWVGLMAGPQAQADFVVSMAGMHEPMGTTMARQSEAMIRAAGGNDASVAANRQLQEAVFAVLSDADPADGDIAARIEAALIEAGAPESLAQQQAAIWGQPYAAAAFQMDPREAAAGYDGPVLAIFGANDLQVLAGPNADALIASRPSATTRTVTVEGVDHLFQANESGSMSAYGAAGHAIDPGAAEVFTEELRLLLDRACGD